MKPLRHPDPSPPIAAIAAVALCATTLVSGACRGAAEAGSADAKTTLATRKAEPPPKNREVATFAGGCFWCMEPPFDAVDGVEKTISGYTGGADRGPSYRQVASGRTGHAEAIRVIYDPDEVDYETLLQVFWRNVDPTDPGGQFVDRGRQYRTAIFVHDARQRKAAERSKKELEMSNRFERPIVTEIVSAGPFWIAEDYHQDFYKKSPGRYKSYRRGSGRDQYIRKKWGEHKGEGAKR